MRRLWLVLLIELVVAITLGQMAQVRRFEYDRAFAEWRQRPTPATSQAFETQKHLTEGVRWGLSGVVFAVLAGVTIIVYKVRRGKPVAAGNAGERTRQGPGSAAQRD